MPRDSDPSSARHLSYLDFELEISPGGGREYAIAVIDSPAGEARETMRFPFDELALENRLQALQIALLRSGGRRRQVLSPEEQTVQDFGRELFGALFTGEVRSRYDMSRQQAAQQGKGLRLKLRIQPPELAALPWEFLYDSRQGEYVCLSRHTPVVRYLELPQPIQPFTVTPPLRILGMVVSPRDLASLDIDREKQRMEKAIKDLRARGLVELVWLEGQTWRDLQRAMRSGPWHIFHFIGHGGFDQNADEGLIALADEEGLTHHRLRATQLGRLLADHHSLRLILLNACEGARGSERDIFSSTATILVRRGLPAVLAMQYEITDRAAIEFACAFYEALADEMPVDAAVAEARKAISMEVADTVEWGTPVLYMRSPDGILFHLVQKPPEEVAGQRERLRREALQARQQTVTAREEAERVEAERYAAGPFGQGAVAQEEADRKLQAQEFEEAVREYRRAQGAFAQAAREAEQERARQVVETARERMEEVKEGLGALTQWTGAKWAAAKEQETEAERAWQAQDYRRAAERYEQACQSYTEAWREAEEARLRQHALEANQQAEQGRTAAKRAEAQLYAPELYQRAKEARGQGERSLAVKRWEAAAKEFVQAQELFAQAIESGQSEKAKQAAVAAYQSMEGSGQVHSPGALPQEVRNSIGMKFVLIPAGEFLMGASDEEVKKGGRASDEEVKKGGSWIAAFIKSPIFYGKGTVHKVRISQPFYLGISQPFYLGKYEVTQAQWEAVMGNNPSHFKGDPNRPVESVSWEEVQEFIRKLNAREGGSSTACRRRPSGSTRAAPAPRPLIVLATTAAGWASMPGMTRTLVDRLTQ